MMLAIEIWMVWAMIGGDILGVLYVAEWLLGKWRKEK